MDIGDAKKCIQKELSHYHLISQSISSFMRNSTRFFYNYSELKPYVMIQVPKYWTWNPTSPKYKMTLRFTRVLGSASPHKLDLRSSSPKINIYNIRDVPLHADTKKAS